MSESGEAPPPPPTGMMGDLSAGLRALAESGFNAPADASPERAMRSTTGRPAPPLPPLTVSLAEVSRRQVTPEGLAVADAIIAASGRYAPSSVARTNTGGVPLASGTAPARPQHDSSPLPTPPPPVEASSRSGWTVVNPANRSGAEIRSAVTLVPTGATIIGPEREIISLEEGGSIVIGRQPDPGGLTVVSAGVSRRHVRIEMRLGQLLAVDLGSTNGTAVVSSGAVTSMRPQVAVPLAVGDRLVVNGDVLLCSVEQVAGAF